MALKSVFSAMKKEGYVAKELDMYLLSLNNKGNDRAIDVNAPSQATNCMRANYYARMQYEKDGNSIDARTRRIFDNGTGVHDRLQAYLKDQGMLILDEVPLRNDELNIQGHTDGFLQLTPNEIGILEIKSINTNQFSQLKDAKEDHKIQALVYLYCAEERRKYLQDTYKTTGEFESSEAERIKYFKSLYTHLTDGNKYTREEKLQHKVEEHLKADDILYTTRRPVDKVIVVYEDKNDQNIKEFCVKRDEEKLNWVIDRYKFLNGSIASKTIPDREGKGKSAPPCRWCNYRDSQCYII